MRTVLITGGSRGIGAACVEKFTALGDKVFFTFRTSLQEAEALAKKTGATPICADGANPEAVLQMVAAFKEQGVVIDVLVNNAGIAQEKLFTDITLSDWNQMFDHNLKNAFLTTQAILPDMIHQKKGAIVNVSSIWGEVGASCEVHYSAAKAALIGMSKALAKELAPSGIRVNCVTPGMIDTDMNACYSEEDKAAIIEEIPLMRMGTPADVAETIAFLCDERASYLTGQVIGINGGWNI